jgi:hypothetical protein
MSSALARCCATVSLRCVRSGSWRDSSGGSSVSRAAYARGDPARAARLIGRADMLLEEAGTQQTDDPVRDETEAELRARLGEDAYAACTRTGARSRSRTRWRLPSAQTELESRFRGCAPSHGSRSRRVPRAHARRPLGVPVTMAGCAVRPLVLRSAAGDSDNRLTLHLDASIHRKLPRDPIRIVGSRAPTRCLPFTPSPRGSR